MALRRRGTRIKERPLGICWKGRKEMRTLDRLSFSGGIETFRSYFYHFLRFDGDRATLYTSISMSQLPALLKLPAPSSQTDSSGRIAWNHDGILNDTDQRRKLLRCNEIGVEIRSQPVVFTSRDDTERDVVEMANFRRSTEGEQQVFGHVCTFRSIRGMTRQEQLVNMALIAAFLLLLNSFAWAKLFTNFWKA